MSYKKRLFFFGFFTLLFLILIPVVLLYSMGYRLTNLSLSNFTNGFTVSPTGGAYVFYSKPGANIFVDDKFADSTTFFKRGVFIENLKAGSYNIRVEYPDFKSWHKTLLVENQHVVESYPFLIRNEIATTSIFKFNSVSEMNDGVVNDEYIKTIALFTVATTSNQNLIQNLNQLNEKFTTKNNYSDTNVVTEYATSTKKTISSLSTLNQNDDKETIKVLDARGDIQIVLVGTTTNPFVHPSLEARYKGSIDNAPLTFCLSGNLNCTNKITLLNDASGLETASFYFGRADVFIYINKSGIFVSEFDSRSPRNTYQIISNENHVGGKALDFRIKDGQSIVVKDGDAYYNALIQ